MQIPSFQSIQPVDPFGTGTDFQVGSVDATGAGATGGTSAAGSFGSMLTDQISNLNDLQNTAASQSQALATGQAQDVSQVVADVEKAALAMQLAVQVRNKAVDAYNELFRIQI
jgi:flagellar hook-basal body complex protein FliE